MVHKKCALIKVITLVLVNKIRDYIVMLVILAVKYVNKHIQNRNFGNILNT